MTTKEIKKRIKELQNTQKELFADYANKLNELPKGCSNSTICKIGEEIYRIDDQILYYTKELCSETFNEINKNHYNY